MSVFGFLLLHAILLLFCICSTMRLSTANILGNETDRLSLLAFKSQITQDPFKVMSSWNDSIPFCQWEGVTCARRHQRVKVLNLRFKDLMGPISPHIGNLSFLRILSLTNNRFHDDIPPEIGQLFRLEYLDVHNNSLVGKISATISRCSNLVNLFLSKNELVGKIPMELGSLSKLVNLDLEENKLTGSIPSSLGNLTSLQGLGLSSNSLSGSIPSTLEKLKRLNSLSLGINKLSGMFPPFFYNLSTLEMISITNNKLSGNLPRDIGLNLPNILSFLIGGNQFHGPIPTSLFNASKLQKFDGGDNQFTGIVPLSVGNLKDLEFLALEINDLGSGKLGDLDFFTPLTNCSSLQKFSIFSNQFGGRLPTSIANFSTQLSFLNLAQNQISGNIPTEIENLQNLISLNLDDNFFNGSIPMGLGSLQKLQSLRLDSNQLSGHVPSFIRNMPQLFRMTMSSNMLEGSISSILENQILQILDLSYNNFTGTIPKEIGLSPRFFVLVLTQNSLNGSIPLEVGSLKNLEYLDVSENKMSGEIPSVLGSCSKLVVLYLQGNIFQGPLPSSLQYLIGLDSLDVSRNNLSGNVPKELGKLSVLTSLNLSFNNFEGEMPIHGIFRNASAFSVVGNHKICGGIPNLGLPKCHIQRSQKHLVRLVLKVTLGVLIPSFILGLSLVIYMWKRPKAMPSSEQRLGDLERVSYNDLNKATDGFSSENLIGLGSYGSVYKGVLHQDEGPIAVKVLNLMERGASKTFFAECEALRVIRHRNLLKILTVCSSVDFSGNDFKALVYEFMPNGSLESWLHPSSNRQHVPGILNIYQRLNIAINIASDLDYLHNHCERPIAHCDLKPSNVLLDDDLTAHVGDFGIAKFLSKTTSTSTSNKDETSSVSIRGTIGYIPPEYGAGAEVSTEGDVYSYGILLLEILTGKRPTDPMFKDGLSLHSYSNFFLSQRVMEIIDIRLLSEETHNEAANSRNQIEEYLSSIMRIGVACSMDLITERMDIKVVLKEMNSIKEAYLQVSTHD